MQTATSDTHWGRWIDFRNAEEICKIKSMKKMKRLCPPNMAFEHGSNVTAPYPYNKFDFVYLCPTAPDTWTASNNYCIRLRGWCKLCLYFSDKSNTSKPESMYRDLFSDYTGLPATVENIRHSFKDRLLISSDSLQEQLKDREAAKSKAKKKKPKKPKPAVLYKECQGVQSKAMDEHASNDLEYCKARGWYYKADKWHAKDCSDTGLDEKGQCKKCKSLKSNFNKTRHPHLYQSTPPEKACTTVITPATSISDIRAAYSTPVLQSIIQNRCRAIEFSAVPTDPEIQEAAKLLNINNEKQVDIDSSTVFIVCGECSEGRVCQKRSNNVELCGNCQSRGRKQRWQDNRRIENAGIRNDPHSKVNYRFRSNEELSAVTRKLRRKRYCVKYKIDRLEKRLKDNEVEMEMTEELLTHLESELEYAQNNKTEVKSSIKEAIQDLLKEEAERVGSKYNSNDFMPESETYQLADYLTESIKNFVLKKAGKGTQCRFSPYLMGLCMNRMLVSGRSSYEQERESSVVVIPGSEKLTKLKQKQEVKEGRCASLYEDQMLLRESELEFGEVMCDEMKEKEAVLYNVANRKAVGFTGDFIDKKKIMKNLLDENEINSFCAPATYVNQWRYRSINGRSFNCEFWCNSGSLSGNALLEQFNRVVMSCEAVGCMVLGFVCDAGGSNARMMKLLRGNKPLPEGSWLEPVMVRTKNPYDPNRYIYLFHCSTHDMKAMRNAFYASWTKGGARQFRDIDDTKIGKGIIDKCYQRENERESRHFKPISDVRWSTVNLNRWSKMNVSEALKIVKWKTLCETGMNLYDRLGVKTVPELLKKEAFAGESGYMLKTAKHFKTLLQSIPEDKVAADGDLAEDISSFEWLANVHEIFIVRLMNMKEVIDAKNIDR